MAFEREIAECVTSGNTDQIREYVSKALDAGDDPRRLIDSSLVVGMNEVGKLYEAGEMFIPEVLWAAQAVNEAMALLEPLLVGEAASAGAKGRILVGTVKGDEHSIGKELVSVILRSNGYQVTDLGVDVSRERFQAAIRDYQPDIVGLSALLTTTMASMRDTVAFLSTDTSRKSYKIIVGGALVTGRFADEIGADGYAPDAGSAADLVNELMLGTA